MEGSSITHGGPLFRPSDQKHRKGTFSESLMPGLGFTSKQNFEPFYRSEDDAPQSWEDLPPEEH